MGTRWGLSLETATLKPVHPLQMSHLWMLVHPPPLSCREGEHSLLHFGCLPAHHLGTAKAGRAPGPTPAAGWGCRKGVPSKTGGLGHSSPPRCQGKRCHPPLAPAPHPPAAWHACSQASEGGKEGWGGCTPLPPSASYSRCMGGTGSPPEAGPIPGSPWGVQCGMLVGALGAQASLRVTMATAASPR